MAKEKGKHGGGKSCRKYWPLELASGYIPVVITAEV